MAKEYIEREAAYQTLTEYYHHTTEGMHSALREAISRVPAADVRPVVRGVWEKDEGFDEYGGGRYVEWTCSECFCKIKGGWAVRDSHIDEKPRENFCPNCGADMREES